MDPVLLGLKGIYRNANICLESQEHVRYTVDLLNMTGAHNYITKHLPLSNVCLLHCDLTSFRSKFV